MCVREARQGMEADSAKRFPERVHVLAVDDDPVSLMVLEALLRHYKYRVTMAGDPVAALRMLREGKEKFDLVISDVHVPQKDGFELLKVAGREMDLPVIMLSAHEDTETVKKGITLGACYCWVKPVTAKEVENIWLHVVRKIKSGPWSLDSSGGNADANENALSETTKGERVFYKSSRKYSGNTRNVAHSSDENKENEPELLTRKKPRMAWTNELHRKFVEVVNQIGIDKAVPKKILAMMGVDYISRASIASHLQKYRLHCKRTRDDARMNPNLFADASERLNSICNRPESFNHYHGHGGYHSSAAIASSNRTNLFTRIDHPAAFGARGAVFHGSNMFSKDVVPGSSLLPNVRHGPSSNNSYANMPNNTMKLGAFASYHSGNDSSYANILRGKLLEASKGNQSGNSFAYRSNVVMSSPINRLPVQSSSRLGHQTSVKRNPLGDIRNCLGNSWQAATKFPRRHKDGRTSVDPSQANFPNINQLTGLATSSVGQIPMYRNELRNPMAAVVSNTTNMACTHEKTAPFDLLNNNNISSAEMLNGNFARGSASGTSSALPDFQMGTSAAPTQMLNGGGADGVLPVQEDGTVHLETFADKLKHINDDLLEIDVPEGSISTDGYVVNEDFISIYDYFPSAC